MEKHTSKIKKYFKLSNNERMELKRMLHSTSKASIYRRVETILAIEEGESPSKVANRLQISRQVIYKWINKFQSNRSIDIKDRLTDGKRTGRPQKISGIIDSWILEVIDTDPRNYNYSATTWTAKLLSQYILDKHNLSISYTSVRRALDRLNFRWKRPRYILSKKPPNWRLKKGA